MLIEIYMFVNNWNNISLYQIFLKGKGIIMNKDYGKEFYMELINELVKKCDDIELLDLIVQLLQQK